MRVTMLTTNLSMSGGIQKLVLRSARELADRGHDVRILTLEYDPERCYPELSRTVSVTSARPGVDPLEGCRELAAELGGDDALIVHDVGSLPILDFADFGEERPKILWMLNHQYNPVSFSGVKRVAIILRACWRARSLRGLGRVSAEWRAARHTLRALQTIDTAMTYDRFNAQRLRAARPLNTQLVYAGADLEDFRALRAERDGRGPAFTILSVGVMLPYRRFEDLIEAVAMANTQEGHEDLPDIRLVIVGSDSLAPDYGRSLSALVAEHQLEHCVEFRGAVTDAEMKDLYRQADAFAFVNDGNTWGISVFESLAAAIPVILTDNVGAADLVVDGIHALIVPPRSPHAIAASLAHLRRLPDGGTAMAERGYENVADVVSWTAFTDRLERTLSSVRR